MIPLHALPRFALYGTLLLFALAGAARMALFVINRAVFGERHEGNRMKLAVIFAPVALMLLTILYIPLYQWVEQGRPSLAGSLGGCWLAISALCGSWWIIDRVRQNFRDRSVPGTALVTSEVIRLRKAHIPFKTLQRLGFHNDLYDLEVNELRVDVRDLEEPFDGFRIAFISDTHVAGFMRRAFYRELVAQINRRAVDLILFGGDYISWRRHIPLMAEVLLNGLEAKEGMYAVLGNHDYWADRDEVVAAMTGRGVRFLVNRSVAITRGAHRLDIVGIDEIYRGEPEVAASFRGIPSSKARVVVSHHPDIVDLLGDERADLLLCGHTHGGQIRLPFFGPPVVPSRHEAKYDQGFFQERNWLMYVGRGLGAVPPIRILCRPELPIFELKRLAG